MTVKAVFFDIDGTLVDSNDLADAGASALYDDAAAILRNYQSSPLAPAANG